MTGDGGEARREIFARIRQALGPDPVVEDVPRDYRTGGAAGGAGLLDLLAERLEDYRATVFRTDPDGLAATVAEAVAAGVGAGADGAGAGGTGAGGTPRIVVPTGVPATWVAADAFVRVPDDALTAAALDGTDGVLTGAAVAIAETGTIVLDSSDACGRRAVTLVPDLHVCVVTADQVVASVPEGVAGLDPTRPLTWISGPSATSDIELDRVEGVHGPRTLHVVLVGPDVSR